MKSRIVPTLKEVAKHFDVAYATARGWVTSGCPGERGNYDLDAIKLWHDNRSGVQKHRGQRSGDYLRKLKAEADKKEADAARALFDLEVQRGNYRPLAEFQSWYQAQVSACKRAFLSLQKSLPPHLEGKLAREMEAEIGRQIRNVLQKLAERP